MADINTLPPTAATPGVRPKDTANAGNNNSAVMIQIFNPELLENADQAATGTTPAAASTPVSSMSGMPAAAATSPAMAPPNDTFARQAAPNVSSSGTPTPDGLDSFTGVTQQPTTTPQAPGQPGQPAAPTTPGSTQVDQLMSLYNNALQDYEKAEAARIRYLLAANQLRNQAGLNQPPSTSGQSSPPMPSTPGAMTDGPNASMINAPAFNNAGPATQTPDPSQSLQPPYGAQVTPDVPPPTPNGMTASSPTGSPAGADMMGTIQPSADQPLPTGAPMGTPESTVPGASATQTPMSPDMMATSPAGAAALQPGPAGQTNTATPGAAVPPGANGMPAIDRPFANQPPETLDQVLAQGPQQQPQQVFDALKEIYLTRNASQQTPQLLAQIAQQDSSKLDPTKRMDMDLIRQLALIDMAALSKQSGDTTLATSLIGNILNSKTETPMMLDASVQALRILNKPEDPTVKNLLTQATKLKGEDPALQSIRDSANLGLQGQGLQLPEPVGGTSSAAPQPPAPDAAAQQQMMIPPGAVPGQPQPPVA